MENNKFRDFLYMTTGSIIMAVGIFFFKSPNGFATGGVSGIGILLGKITKLSSATWILIINLIILVLGVIVLGKKLGIRTIYCTIVQAGLTKVFDLFITLDHPITDDPLLELIIAIICSSVGAALMFYVHASSGGTDIIALILKKYTSLDISIALLIVDAVVVISSFFIYNITIGLYSALGWLIHAFIIDYLLDNLHKNKFFMIITDDPRPIMDYVCYEMNRSATVLNGEGAFTHHEKTVLEVVCSKKEAPRFQRKIKELDPHAFTIITNSAGVLGHRWEEEDL